MKIVLAVFTILTYIHFIECHEGHFQKMQEMKEMIQKCKKENNYEGGFKELFKQEITENDKPRYCTMACINTANGVMFSNNTINVDKFTSVVAKPFHISEEISNKILEDYNHAANGVSDACEAAKILFSCIQNNTGVWKKNMMKIKDIFDKCNAENKPSPNFHNIMKKHEAVTEKADACTLACVDIEFGIMSNEGKVNVEKLESTLKFLRISNVEEVAKKCSEAVKEISDKCEVAKTLYNCYRNKI